MTEQKPQKTSRVRINLGDRNPQQPQPTPQKTSRVRINLTGKKK